MDPRIRAKPAALGFMKKALKRYGILKTITTDGLRSCRAAMTGLGNVGKQEIGRWANNRVENSYLPFRRRERAMLRFRQMKRLHKFASVQPTSTTTSTLNAASSIDRPTSPADRPRWPSGGRSWLESGVPRRQLRRSETSCD